MIAGQFRIDMLERPRIFEHAVDVSAALVSERALSDVWLAVVVCFVRHLGHKPREFHESAQPVPRYALHPELENNIGYGRAEIVVAAPLTDAVNGSLNMGRAVFDPARVFGVSPASLWQCMPKGSAIRPRTRSPTTAISWVAFLRLYRENDASAPPDSARMVLSIVGIGFHGKKSRHRKSIPPLDFREPHRISMSLMFSPGKHGALLTWRSNFPEIVTTPFPPRKRAQNGSSQPCRQRGRVRTEPAIFECGDQHASRKNSSLSVRGFGHPPSMNVPEGIQLLAISSCPRAGSHRLRLGTARSGNRIYHMADVVSEVVISPAALTECLLLIDSRLPHAFLEPNCSRSRRSLLSSSSNHNRHRALRAPRR